MMADELDGIHAPAYPMLPGDKMPDLNLAGAQGAPSPLTVAHAQRVGVQEVHEPDFAVPDTDVPALKPYDLVGPGINYVPEFEADPVLPDLEEYGRPLGVEIQDNSMLAVDPQVSDLQHYDAYDAPAGLSITKHALDADPTVPDLQDPELEQAVHMTERPGDLADAAMAVMHDTASYQQVSQKMYPGVWMDQRGMNSTRTRHLSLLDYGFESMSLAK